MFRIEDGLHVSTPEAPPVPGTVIRLHPTGRRARGYGWELDTADGLRWLNAAVQPGMTVVDIGTGTGILAIAAALMGAEVVAYEEDDEAREIAAENFRLNRVVVALRGAYDGADGFDLVVTNLGDIEYGAMLTAGAEVWTSG